MLKVNGFPLYETLVVFETGILFWGTFVGLLSGLIISDNDYIQYHVNRHKCNVSSIYLWSNVFMFLICLAFIYFGSMLKILKSLGGTYMVFWSLDVQTIIMLLFKDISLTTIFSLDSKNPLWKYPSYFSKLDLLI